VHHGMISSAVIRRVAAKLLNVAKRAALWRTETNKTDVVFKRN